MFNNKNELIKQVNWALRAREPIGLKAVSDVSAKWKPAGYEMRFDGGQAVIAHFEGRIVVIAWQQMGDVERHLFAKILHLHPCLQGRSSWQFAGCCQLLCSFFCDCGQKIVILQVQSHLHESTWSKRVHWNRYPM